MRLSTYIVPVFLCLVPAVSSYADAQSEIVRVDCGKGQSINRALAAKAEELTIEIRGLCHESVIVSRDRVTLRGSDADVAGIAAPPGEG